MDSTVGKRSKQEAEGRLTAGPYPDFDLDSPDLPKAIAKAALGSAGYPYSEKLEGKVYERRLRTLQIELAKLQVHLNKIGERLVIVFEGRDSAGKGGCIQRFTAHLNPRSAHIVALSKPTEAERGQWYFQRYAARLPTKGEMTLFDRSWYNRAGVERVMGFATPDQVADFLREAPEFEGMLVRDGIRLVKIYLDIGREMQLKRFHARRHDPLKRWKLSPIDLEAIARWDDYTRAKADMFRFTHTAIAPWSVIRANDQRRARLEAIRLVLMQHDYEGRDDDAVGELDPKIVGASPEFFEAG
jgi:polyphosphate kinase 2